MTVMTENRVFETGVFLSLYISTVNVWGADMKSLTSVGVTSKRATDVSDGSTV
jgi:hypothetical protein